MDQVPFTPIGHSRGRVEVHAPHRFTHGISLRHMVDDMTIEVLDHLTDADAPQPSNGLLLRLSSSKKKRLRTGTGEAMIRNAATDLFVARVDGSIVGMAT